MFLTLEGNIRRNSYVLQNFALLQYYLKRKEKKGITKKQTKSRKEQNKRKVPEIPTQKNE